MNMLQKITKNFAKMNKKKIDAENVAKTNILLDCGRKEINDYDNNTNNFLPVVNKHRAGNKLQVRLFLGEFSNLCYRVI